MSEKKNANKNMIKDLRNDFNDERQKGEMLTVMTGKNYDIVDTSLPPNFFEQIIMNEIELSEGFHYEKLKTLVQLYLNAIQYYSSAFPEKVRAYQNRLEYLLTQKETLKNLCKMKNEEVKTSKSSTQIRQSAKTGFMVQTKNIKHEDIKNKVNKVINDNKSIKEHKKNVKILLNNDLENQNKKWKEKLALKKSKMNSNRPLLRTSCRRFFNTPGPILRKSMNIENKVEISRFEKSGKNLPKYGNIDDDDSEEENISENNGEEDVLRMFKERHNMDDEKKDSDDEGSIIDDNYNDCMEKIDEVEEEIRKDSNKNIIKNIENKNNNNQEKKLPLKGILKKKDKNKEIDNKDVNKENNEVKNDENKEKENNQLEEKANEEKTDEIKKDEENKNVEKNEEIKKDEEIKDKENKDEVNNNKEENKIEEKNEGNKEEVNKEEEKKEENKKEDKNDVEEDNDSLAATNIIKDNNGEINIEKMKPLERKKSIVDEIILKDIEPDEDIQKTIEEKMQILNNLKSGNELGEDSNPQSSSNLPIVTKKEKMEEIPPIFQETMMIVEEKVKEYISSLNNHFYKDTFEDFSLKLKELYDSKYEKYIMINNEYHSSITEKEYSLQNDENLNEEKKIEMQNIIDSLKEEQKDQIDKIVDEYNNNIILLINEFKQNSFKNNTSIQLLEEYLKLDIYTLINDAFY